MSELPNIFIVVVAAALITAGLLILFSSLSPRVRPNSLRSRVLPPSADHRTDIPKRAVLKFMRWPDRRAPGRRESARQAFPDLLDLLALSVAAGMSFDAALARATEAVSGPLHDELTIVMSDISLGIDRADAFAALARRLKLDEVLSVAAAIGHADALGTPIADVVRDQARATRETRLRQLEERTQKLPVKLLLPLILCILPALFVVIIGPAVLQIIDSGLLG